MLIFHFNEKISQKPPRKSMNFKTDMKLSQYVKLEYVKRNDQKLVFWGVFEGSKFLLPTREGPWTVYSC